LEENVELAGDAPRLTRGPLIRSVVTRRPVIRSVVTRRPLTRAGARAESARLF